MTRIRSPLRPCGLFAIAVVGLLLGSAPASAQLQRSYLNPGFETPALVPPAGSTGCYVLVSETLLPGWDTTHPSGGRSGTCTSPSSPNGPLIELWRSTFNGVLARSGNNFAELNAAAASRMFQNVCLINNEAINWRFSHRGRGSNTIPDVMDYNIGASDPIVRVNTTANGAMPNGLPVAFQGTVDAPGGITNGWRDYSGRFTYTGATGINSMGFEAISAGSGNNTVGNFLDNIQIELAPFVEFVQPSSSTPEGATSNVPTLRVDGTAFSAFTVTVTITGGTASLGTDYSTPGNSSTLTVSIPAGTYEGDSASEFPLPISITQDALIEGNETIDLRIEPAGGAAPAFLLYSTDTCGATAQRTWNYTIVDDDARITLTKSEAAPVAVSGQPTQFDVAYTVVVNNPSAILGAQYSLVDTPGMDADVSIVSASVSRNSGAATALGAAPWTLQSQWRTLAPGATDTYLVMVRISIARGGSTANDGCADPSAAGSGLHNAATATVQATAGVNPTFTASTCRATPTPVWATLNKSITSRVAAIDQFRIRTLTAGSPAATATTSGTATTATTGTIVIQPGSVLTFDEALVAGGVPVNYDSTISCSNAANGSSTVLPSGAGADVAGFRRWPEITTRAGDDVTCTIINTPGAVDLVINKSNSATQVVSGTTTTYVVTVSNLSQSRAVTGAIVRDTPVSGVSCPQGNIVTCSGPTGACPTTGLTVGTLVSSGGMALGSLAAGASTTLTFTCNVQ